MNTTSKEKPNSLSQLGYSIEEVKSGAVDKHGNKWLFKVVGKAPSFYIKQTRSGKLLAYRKKDDPMDTTINGLYDFDFQNGDLIGKRASVPSAKKPMHVVKKEKAA